MTNEDRIKKLKALVEKLLDDYDAWAESCQTDLENLDAAAELCEWDECVLCCRWIKPGQGHSIQTEPTVLHPADRAYPGEWEKWCDECYFREDEP